MVYLKFQVYNTHPLLEKYSNKYCSFYITFIFLYNAHRHEPVNASHKWFRTLLERNMFVTCETGICKSNP